MACQFPFNLQMGRLGVSRRWQLRGQLRGANTRRSSNSLPSGIPSGGDGFWGRGACRSRGRSGSGSRRSPGDRNSRPRRRLCRSCRESETCGRGVGWLPPQGVLAREHSAGKAAPFGMTPACDEWVSFGFGRPSARLSKIPRPLPSYSFCACLPAGFSCAGGGTSG